MNDNINFACCSRIMLKRLYQVGPAKARTVLRKYLELPKVAVMTLLNRDWLFYLEGMTLFTIAKPPY